MKYWLGYTGGTGFVGSTFIRRCRKTFTENGVLSLGRRNSGFGDFEYFDFSLDSNSSVVHSIETFVHIASYIPLNQGRTGDFSAESSNGKGMIRLGEKLDLSFLKRFINVSSAHYNDEKTGLLCNPYEASKFSAEMILNAFAFHYGFSLVNLRVSYIYGPGMHHGNLFRLFIKKALSGETIHLDNKGENRINCIFHTDIVDAIFDCIEDDSLVGNYYACGRKSISVKEIAQLIKKMTRSSSEIMLEDNGKIQTAFGILDDPDIPRLPLGKETRLEQGIKTMLIEEFGVEP